MVTFFFLNFSATKPERNCAVSILPADAAATSPMKDAVAFKSSRKAGATVCMWTKPSPTPQNISTALNNKTFFLCCPTVTSLNPRLLHTDLAFKNMNLIFSLPEKRRENGSVTY